MSHLKETEKAVDEARRKSHTLLELADVPEGHRVEKKVTSAFIGLEEALEELPRAGRKASAIYESGLVIFPIQGRDPRDWPTSIGQTVRQAGLLGNGRYASFMNNSAGIRLATQRRAMSTKEYLQALEDAETVPSPITAAEDRESFTLVQIG